MTSVAFTGEGKLLLSGSGDKTVMLWGGSDYRGLGLLGRHKDGVTAIAVTGDSRLAASASFDKTVRVWDLAAKACIATLAGHTRVVLCVGFSADGRYVASGSHDNAVRVWDVSTRQCVSVLDGHDSGVNDVVFSADGRVLASASNDNTIRQWDVSTAGQASGAGAGAGHAGTVTAVAISGDGRVLASASDDSTVRLWDAALGVPLATLTGHTDAVSSVRFSPVGGLLATAGTDRTTRLWDVASGGACVAVFDHANGDVNSVAWSHDGRRVVTAGDDGVVAVWDVASQQRVVVIVGRSDGVCCVSYSADGAWVGTFVRRDAVVYDAVTGASFLVEGHTESVTSVAFSPSDPALLLTTSSDRTAVLWRLRGRGRVERVAVMRHPKSVEVGVFAGDGASVVTSCSDCRVRVWTVDSGECVATLDGGGKSTTALAVTRNCRTIVAGCYDKAVRVWCCAAGGDWSVTWTLCGHGAWIRALALSHDEKLAASSAEDKKVSGVCVFACVDCAFACVCEQLCVWIEFVSMGGCGWRLWGRGRVGEVRSSNRCFIQLRYCELARQVSCARYLSAYFSWIV